MTVELFDLYFFAYHGLYDFERETGGEFMVDVELDLPDEDAYVALNQVANYETVYQLVKQRMETPLDFIEEVARLILEDVKKAFPQLTAAKVKVTKCAPPIPGMKGAARVTAKYSR